MSKRGSPVRYSSPVAARFFPSSHRRLPYRQSWPQLPKLPTLKKTSTVSRVANTSSLLSQPYGPSLYRVCLRATKPMPDFPSPRGDSGRCAPQIRPGRGRDGRNLSSTHERSLLAPAENCIRNELLYQGNTFVHISSSPVADLSGRADIHLP